MPVDILDPPPHLPSAAAFHLSQQAPRILQSSPRTSLPYPLSLFVSNETPETWSAYETLLLACLQTGDDGSARLCLDWLTERFGEDNERIMALRGMYEEAVALDAKSLEKVLRRYDDILREDPTNWPVRKRRITLLRSLSRDSDAVSALVELLDITPTDAEAWAELSDLYFRQGMYAQAVYCLEEVILITPNAWNIHARLGEILYISATSPAADGVAALALLSDSFRRFCRSVELCEDYLRGFYGLKLTSGRLKTELDTASRKLPSDCALPTLDTVQRLHEMATAKLAEIVQRSSAREAGWTGFAEADVIAARELLDRDVQSQAS